MAGGYCCLGLGGKAHGSRVRDYYNRLVWFVVVYSSY
jgi:hypothetical protein